MDSIDRFFFFSERRRERKHFIANFDEQGEGRRKLWHFEIDQNGFCLNNSSANVYSRTVVAWYDYVDVTSITCSKEYITRYMASLVFLFSSLLNVYFNAFLWLVSFRDEGDWDFRWKIWIVFLILTTHWWCR